MSKNKKHNAPVVDASNDNAPSSFAIYNNNAPAVDCLTTEVIDTLKLQGAVVLVRASNDTQALESVMKRLTQRPAQDQHEALVASFVVNAPRFDSVLTRDSVIDATNATCIFTARKSNAPHGGVNDYDMQATIHRAMSQRIDALVMRNALDALFAFRVKVSQDKCATNNAAKLDASLMKYKCKLVDLCFSDNAHKLALQYRDAICAHNAKR